jgi:hypothetical protein
MAAHYIFFFCLIREIKETVSEDDYFLKSVFNNKLVLFIIPSYYWRLSQFSILNYWL